MSDEWEINPGAPTFSLFKKRTPEEESKKDGFVDIIIYNRWSKAERRLYQKLKTQRIVKQIEERHLNDLDSITSALEDLTLLKRNTSEPTHPEVDDLIGRLEQIKFAKEQA